jgi:uncharacterized protein
MSNEKKLAQNYQRFINFIMIKTMLEVSVSPKSSANRIVIDGNGFIKVYLTAPPVDGKANAGLLAFISKKLKIPKSDIDIVYGEKGKKKRLAICGLLPDEILEKLKEK